MELVQYFIVNYGLIEKYNMSIGKIGAQIAHAATLSARELTLKDDPIFKDWLQNSQTKIVLKGKENDLIKLSKQGFYAIIDEGRTEIPTNSLTVVALPPMDKEKAKQYVKRLRLL